MSDFLAITTALKKIAACHKKIVIVQGGARAGKTMAILMLIVDYAMRHNKHRIAIVSHSYPHLMRGAVEDTLNICEELGMNRLLFNKNDKVIKFVNTSRIDFITADKIQDFKGTQFDVAFINEANYISNDVANQIIMRTIDKCYIDYNPTRSFWAHELLKLRPDVDFVKLNYKDNEALPDGIRKELETIDKVLRNQSKYWANYARIYIDGEIGNSIDVVYPEWKSIAEIPTDAKLVCVGVDFGFVNDVTAIVAIYKHNNTFIIDELAYSTGMLTDAIAKILAQTKSVPIYCDNAEPRTITELNKTLKHARCFGVKFGITESIDIVAKQTIYVTQRSVNIQREQIEYVYKRDKYTGELTNIPVETNNHAMDAIRYGICGFLGAKFTGDYTNVF